MQTEIHQWQTRDPLAGHVATPADRWVAHFIKDAGATVNESNIHHIAHEQQEGKNKQDTKTKALLKQLLAKIKAHLYSPPTTRAGICKRLEALILPLIKYIHKHFKEETSTNHAGDWLPQCTAFFPRCITIEPCPL